MMELQAVDAKSGGSEWIEYYKDGNGLIGNYESCKIVPMNTILSNSSFIKSCVHYYI